jgi:hypothetical protein
MLEIIKNKPMPLDGRALRNSKYSVMDQMEVGDCVIAKTRYQATAMQRRNQQQSGKCFTSRKLPDGTIGVWRIE